MRQRLTYDVEESPPSWRIRGIQKNQPDLIMAFAIRFDSTTACPNYLES
jgi:hypothetical protein